MIFLASTNSLNSTKPKHLDSKMLRRCEFLLILINVTHNFKMSNVIEFIIYPGKFNIISKSKGCWKRVFYDT